MASLTDPIRLRLLWLLERQELGVVDLCDVLQLPQSTVSRHLKVLGEQGWLDNRRLGTASLYHMCGHSSGATLDEQAKKLWAVIRQQTAEWPAVKQDKLRLTERLRNRTADAQTFFAGAAGDWDKLRAQLYGDSFSTAAMLGLVPADWVVADLGCGTGTIAQSLSPYLSRGKVIGIDQSEAMLKAARKRTAELLNVEVKRGDLEELPLDDGSCDAALLVLVLAYVADPAAVIREIARVLKPGGRAVIVDLLPHDREEFRRQLGQQTMGFDPGEMTRMFNDAGLVNAHCRPLPPEANVKGPALFIATASAPSPG
jgi:ArsR family transcriptional regulator